MALQALMAVLLALAATAQNATGPAPAPAPVPAPGPAPGPPAWQQPVLWDERNRGLRPERLEAFNQSHYYQCLPDDQARGLVVFLHGCARQARAFFPSDPKRCRECVGAG